MLHIYKTNCKKIYRRQKENSTPYNKEIARITNNEYRYNLRKYLPSFKLRGLFSYTLPNKFLYKKVQKMG